MEDNADQQLQRPSTSRGEVTKRTHTGNRPQVCEMSQTVPDCINSMNRWMFAHPQRSKSHTCHHYALSPDKSDILEKHGSNQQLSRNAANSRTTSNVNPSRSSQPSTRFKSSVIPPIAETRMQNLVTIATPSSKSVAHSANGISKQFDFSKRGLSRSKLLNGGLTEALPTFPVKSDMYESLLLPQMPSSAQAYLQRFSDSASSTAYKKSSRVPSENSQFSDNASALFGFNKVVQLSSTITTPNGQQQFNSTVVHSDTKKKNQACQTLPTQTVTPVAGPSRAYETGKLSSASMSSTYEGGNSESVCAVSTNQLASSDDSTSASSGKSNANYATPNGYQCKFCQRRCRSHSTLVTHLRSHTGERPFVCMYCKKGFSQRGTLKCHSQRCPVLTKRRSMDEWKVSEAPTVSVSSVSSTAFVFNSAENLVHLLPPPRPPYALMELIRAPPLYQQPITGANLFSNHEATGQRRLEMSARQIRSEPTIVGVGRGGHRMEDLHYCYTCKLYFADASVFNIHGDVHSIRFECTCSICNEQLFSMGELALHYLQKHPDRRQGAMPSVRLSNDSCIVGRTSSMETKTSNEHLIR